MVGNPLADAALIIVIFILSAIVSAVEAAIQSVSRLELEERLRDDDARAILTLALKEGAEQIRATSKVVVVFALVLLTLLAAPYLTLIVNDIIAALSLQTPWTNVVGVFLVLLATGLVGSIHLIFVSLVARNIGQNNGFALSYRSAGFMRVVVRIFTIPTNIVVWIANLPSKGEAGKATFIDSITSEEGLMDILEEGTKAGLIDETEQELIESIFNFTEMSAREAMIPRTEIIAIEHKMTADEILQVVVEEGYTRMPVFRESMDDIIGVVYAKDVLSMIHHRHLIILDDIIRPLLYVPESKPIPELLREFQYRHQHLAIVVDEFGGTEGLITMEDILEEIVGEIQDEYDEEEELFEKMTDGSVLVQCKLSITDFNEILDYAIPESEDYETVGGFVTAQFGRIPAMGDTTRYENLLIRVMEVEERRVISVIFKRIAETE